LKNQISKIEDKMSNYNKKNFVIEENSPKADNPAFYALILIIGVLPLLFLRFTADPFAIPKYAILTFGSWIVSLIWLSLFFSKGNIYLKRTKLDFFLIFLLFQFALASLFSLEPNNSFLGRYGRYEGFLTYLSYFLLYFLASQIITDQKRIKLTAMTLALTTIPISLYGVLQYLRLDPLRWSGPMLEVGRSFSTLGNPIFLGGFLTLVLPLTLALFLTSNSNQKILWLTAFALGNIALITTFSRSAWLATLTGLTFFTFLWGRKILAKPRYFLALLLTFIILSLTLGTLSFYKPSAKLDFRERLISAFRLSEGTILTRFEIWKASLNIIADKSLFGTGLQNYPLIFPKYQTIAYVRAAGHRATVDDAHNFLLHLPATNGLLALVAFTGLFLVLFSTAIPKLKPKGLEQIMFGALLAASFGYLIHLLFSPSSNSTSPIFWLINGILAGNLACHTKLDNQSLKNCKPLIIIPGFLVVISLLYLISNLIVADYHYLQAIRSEKLGNLPVAIQEYQNAVDFNQPAFKYQIRLATAYINSSFVSSDPLTGYQSLEKGLYLLNKLKQKIPIWIEPRMFLVYGYLIGGERYHPQYLNLALAELKDLKKMTRNNVRVIYYIGRVYYLKKEYQKAVSEFKKALAIDNQYLYAYLYLAKSYQKLGLHQEAERLKREAAKHRIKIDL
jgi:O-antigen ligase